MEAPDPSIDHIVVYRRKTCKDCVLAETVLIDAGFHFQEIDLDEHPEATDGMLKINGGLRRVPTVVLPDGQILVEPSAPVLQHALGRLKSHAHEAVTAP